jgi:hypothetical protein
MREGGTGALSLVLLRLMVSVVSMLHFSKKLIVTILVHWEPGYRSRCIVWLRARRPRGRSSSPGGVKNFPFSTSSRPALGPTQPPIQRLPGVKRPGREADQSPPSAGEVKNEGAIRSFPYAFSWLGADLISTGTTLPYALDRT